MKVKIQVTKGDLTEGDRDKPEFKPAALALNKKLKYPYRSFSGHKKITIYDVRKWRGIQGSFFFPEVAQKSETHFLLKGFARPYHFYLDLPLEMIK